MSRIRINCKHCGQLVKDENTRNGCCYKISREMGRDKVMREILYLNCGRYE